MPKLSQKQRIYDYLKTHETLSKYAVRDYFGGFSGKDKIDPETVSRRLRELREETEFAENIGVAIQRRVYLQDKEGMIYTVLGPGQQGPAQPQQEVIKPPAYDKNGNGLLDIKTNNIYE